MKIIITKYRYVYELLLKIIHITCVVNYFDYFSEIQVDETVFRIA